jgi:hypothetical protein
VRPLLPALPPVLLISLLIAAPACRDKGGDSAAPTDTREACAVSEPERQLLWGDLHVHTANSFDAWVYDVRLTPDDAYRFARGEAMALPLADGGAVSEVVALDRPLDFAAVTDHSEYLGEIVACTTPGNAAYETDFCGDYREATSTSIQSIGTVLAAEAPDRIEAICDEVDCLGLASGVWADLQEAAEAHYDRTSDCSFTTFVGYEWTGATGVTNYHRNVLFRTATVPDLPASYFEAPDPDALWDALYEQCIDDDACDALAIPHNSNMSNGSQFYPEYPAGEDEADAAARRVAIEPVIEIFQHKGDSECANGVSGILGEDDPACDFEKLRGLDFEDCGDEPGSGAMANLGCVHRLDFVRGILLEGMLEEQRIGVNPYRLGITAATDTHSGTPGLVDEASWPGHLGTLEGSTEGRLSYPSLNPGGVINNPGGLTAVWAEANDRDSLFEALRRREVYGTSGPRIGVRFFGGYGLDADLCDASDLVARADAGGVPMGGALPAGEGAPAFVLSAWRDPEGAPLERIQIVKGWIDADGQRNQAVYDLASAPGGAVDLASCEPAFAGADTLCAVWTDEDYDPALPTFWYARVLEDPTCRWSTRDCLSLPEGERPESCEDEEIQDTVQERAWTSPIWNRE